ncbi:Exosome complex component rrp45 [Fulvia fulva]|uniref:Exosome complex component RRP45 n=1 Tax=Passalora fulva TaxID=5499 RepID=A0A9Q8LIE3_PASFU|nr:Exosome complex component rrp45 [Fulvia fulva]KAK4624664.1 Exosome complex component rrp45 [Fulvia fulva]KAK4625082.1 Exosome complex component rrp45 [Fulvia fulva]UJO17982.1 Exosome complex component rrp45 [Fulvia fulva]WPV15627.1 Exosome complex component rrp45 [Fulvia fulva]WPV29418.1 Exosome complex component rrp45 [Fulvia fulva]
MPREADPSNNEREFLLAALRENVRLDGRAFDQFRDVQLAFGEEYGVADVRVGKTRVMVNISAEVVTPYPDRKFDGVFIISTELSPIASPAFEVGRQDQTEVLLSRILEKTIRRSGALDTESLCIIAGSKCWHIRADIHVLDHDGNIVDVCCIALIAALMHFRRPDHEIHGEEVTVYGLREREPVKLQMQHQPFCITTSYYEGGEVMIHDATLLEEQCREGEIIISVNRFGEVCQIAKLGGTPVDGLSILTCTNMAVEKAKMLDKLVKAQLEEDEKERDKGGLMAELSAENDRPQQQPIG